MNLQWLSPVDLQEQDGRSSSYAVDTQDARSDLGITSSNHLHHGYELLLPLSETSIEGLRGSSARGSTDATPQALYSTALSALLDMCEPSRASHADNPNTLQQIQSYPERPPQLPPPPPQHQQQQQQSATQPQELHILLQEIEERPSQLPQLQHQRQYSPELQGLLNQRERIQQQAKELLEQDRQLQEQLQQYRQEHHEQHQQQWGQQVQKRQQVQGQQTGDNLPLQAMESSESSSQEWGPSDSSASDRKRAAIELPSELTPDNTPENREAKRPRTALSVQLKLDIIKFHEQNPSVSISAVSQLSKVKRPTIYDVLKNNETVQAFANGKRRAALTLTTKRMAEPPFYIVENLLKGLINSMLKYHVPVTDTKITAQALNIHRALSAMLTNPLPPCQFTSGWLKGFKRRHSITLSPHREPTAGFTLDRTRLRSMLHGYNPNDIYSCDVLHLFMYPTQSSEMGVHNPHYANDGLDMSIASILLCCNADGSDKREPLLIARQHSNIYEADGYNEKALDDRTCDIPASSYVRWLSRFDDSLDRRVLLLVDGETWDDSLGCTDLGLQYIQVVKCFGIFYSVTPMSARLSKAFKAHYHILLFKSWKAIYSDPQMDFFKMFTWQDSVGLLRKTWNDLDRAFLQICFEPFFTLVNLSRLDGMKLGWPTDESFVQECKLRRKLERMFPMISKRMVQYYLDQDHYIEPSIPIHYKLIVKCLDLSVEFRE